MRAVGIQDFAIHCALGETRQQVWNNAVVGSTAGMIFDNQWLDDGTYLGRLAVPDKIANSAFNPNYDCRINRLLCHSFESIRESYQKRVKNCPPHRIGVVLGTSTSGVDVLENSLPDYDRHRQWPKQYRPYIQRMGCVAECLADYLSLKGPAMSVSTACSSSAKAVLTARQWLLQDLCEVVICGGIDVLCQLTVRGFHALGALSAKPSVPFSRHRDGINIGEAAALLLLSKQPAEVNVLGGAGSSDAHHISAPDPNAGGAIKAMQAALDDAELAAEQIDYVNLHGTGTKQNDAMEAKAIHQVFQHSVACGSNKAMVGHTLGAAGALELALSALSMSSLNHQGHYLPHIYDGCFDDTIEPLNLSPSDNHLGRPRYLMSNSFAFGGSNAAVILAQGDML